MQLHFLAASDGAPLTKTFKKDAHGNLEKTSYPPRLFKVTSQPVEVSNTTEFYSALAAAADKGFALQKGELDAVLNAESRANHTLTDKPTEWILFDIDGLPAIDNIESFIKTVLPTAFHDVSYVAQFSASNGIVDKGLSAHLFFLLEKEVSPDKLKSWLRVLNLQNPVLGSALELQRGNQSSLRWPLDVTVAGNDKYVYIAPPVCVGFADPMGGQRIKHVVKGSDRVTVSLSTPTRNEVRRLEREKIQELRDKADLPKLSLRTVSKGGFDVLIDADKVQVTEWWESGGFIHLNINGGDSGAYWVNPKRPKFIRSFKDEPARYLKKVAPEFWNEIKDMCSPDEMLVFRDELTDKFYVGWYDPIEDEYHGLNAISKKNIDDWCEFHFSASTPDPIPQYRLVFDPTKNFAVDRDNRLVNTFQTTPFMHLEADENAEVPKTIKKVISHVVNHDEEAIDWFLNWFAFIFQYRTKSRSALVLHGTKGTGKGVLFNQILKPLLGEGSCQSIQQRDVVNDRFNEYLQRSLLVMFDESEADETFRDKLFHWITEPTIRLRVAYADGKDIQSHTNFMLGSNKPDAAPIEPGDRRFTVGPRQLSPIEITEEEIEVLIPAELSTFARYLLAYKVDITKATKPLNNEAKLEMREAARDTVAVFIEALETGDICYFLEILDASSNDQSMTADAAIKRWAEGVNSGKATPVTTAELHSVYRFISQTNMPVAKFAVMMVKRGIPKPQDIEVRGHATRGIEVEWKAPAKRLLAYKDIIKTVRAPTINDDIERSVLKIGD